MVGSEKGRLLICPPWEANAVQCKCRLPQTPQTGTYCHIRIVESASIDEIMAYLGLSELLNACPINAN